ncbi:MAG: glycerol acyltransferase [Pleurocapsa sp.]
MKRAQPRLRFIPPAFNPLVLKLLFFLLPIFQRWRLQPWLPAGISEVDTINGKTLVKLLQQFQIGKIRLILAFRHCEVDDPLSGLYLFSRTVPKIAKQKKIPLQYPIHSHFMYDRGMPLWAGAWLGWLFSRIGGVPVHRGKALDLVAIKKVREFLINGRFPLTVAPEGATNGHSEVVSPLEPGVAQLGFWCVEDLVKAKRTEQVIILPIGIQYFYLNPQWSKIDWLLSQLEADCGLPQPSMTATDSNKESFYYQRLYKIGEVLLSEMEKFYHRFYHRPIAKLSDDVSHPEEILTIRLQSLLDEALKVGEEYFGLKSQGNVVERCRRLEEVGWNYIYREDISPQNNLSPLKRGLADWTATEADLRMKHMRLVESFVAVTGTYVKEKPTFERFAETALIFFDVLARIKGKKMPRRPRLGWRKAQLTVSEPINISDRWSTYQQNRQAAKQAVNKLTQDLQTALEKTISY